MKPGGETAATIHDGRRGHDQETAVKGGAQAVPRKTATPAQLTALAKAQEVRNNNEARRPVERLEEEWEAWLAE